MGGNNHKVSLILVWQPIKLFITLIAGASELILGYPLCYGALVITRTSLAKEIFNIWVPGQYLNEVSNI